MDQFVNLLITHFTYAGIVLILIGSGFGLPIPEDIPLITGGYLSAKGFANIYFMLPLTFAAVLGSDTILYFIGRRYGHHVPKLPIFNRYLTPKRLSKAEMAFRRRGGLTLFTSRFVPGVRAAVFFTAGVFRIPLWKVLAFDGSAALISVPTLVLLGYFGSEEIEKVRKLAGYAQIVVGLIAVTGIVIYLLRKRSKKLHPDADESTETPDAPNAPAAPQAPDEPRQ